MEKFAGYMPTDPVEIDEEGLPIISVANAKILLEIMTAQDTGKNEGAFLIMETLRSDQILAELIGDLASHYLGRGRNGRNVLLGAAIATEIYKTLNALRVVSLKEKPACSSLNDLETMLKLELGEKRFQETYGSFIKGIRTHYKNLSMDFENERATRRAVKDLSAKMAAYAGAPQGSTSLDETQNPWREYMGDPE